MKVVLIGSGNTATVLARMMTAAGHSVLQVWSRTLQHAEELAKQVHAVAINSLKDLSPDADIYLITVNDKAIADTASKLKPGKKLVVHTAGSVSREVLKNTSPNYGVLYPLQSLRKEMTIIPPIPFLVDGNTDEVKALLSDFASSLSDKVQIANDETRLQMHLAAVMVSNFTNHLYALTEDYCNERHLNFQLLHPLIIEVACRLDQGKALDMQTGPARRGDEETIQKHLEMLQDYPQSQKIYQLFSESIMKMYKK